MLNPRALTDSIYAVVFVIAFSVVVHDLWVGFVGRSTSAVSWRTGVAMIMLAWLPLVIVIVSGGL